MENVADVKNEQGLLRKRLFESKALIRKDRGALGAEKDNIRNSALMLLHVAEMFVPKSAEGWHDDLAAFRQMVGASKSDGIGNK
jgi:hypothetical protein